MWYTKWLSKIFLGIELYWKEVLILILAIILLFYIKKDPIIKVIQKDNTDLLQELKQYKDRNGNLVSEISQLKMSREEINNRVDSLSRELRISKKNVKTIDHYISSTDTQFYPKPFPVYRGKDTAYKVIQYDNYLNIEAIAGKDTGYILFSLRDTLDRVEKYNPGFLGFGSSTKVLLRTKSPYIQYKQGYSFSIKEKTTWLTIGPSIQYDPFQNKVSVGVSAQIPVIKIKR